MNKKQRDRLNDLIGQVEGIAEEIMAMQEDEQDKYDNMPENLQDSERGEAFQEAADNLQDAADELSSWCEDIRSNLEV